MGSYRRYVRKPKVLTCHNSWPSFPDTDHVAIGTSINQGLHNARLVARRPTALAQQRSPLRQRVGGS